jgi:large subunit ribosomal protein L3
MAKGILGQKLGMTQIFNSEGVLVPVTVIDVNDNVVLQKKSVTTDGYDAVQLGYGKKPEKSANKPELGHLKASKSAPKRFVKEIRLAEMSEFEVGDIVPATIFEAGQYVDVQGTSKGKGFEGTIRRNNQTRGPMSHGSRYHRRPGSMGPIAPNRVVKGKIIPGHEGHFTTTLQNLQIVNVDTARGIILIKGNVPGPNKSFVRIIHAVKGQ